MNVVLDISALLRTWFSKLSGQGCDQSFSNNTCQQLPASTLWPQGLLVTTQPFWTPTQFLLMKHPYFLQHPILPLANISCTFESFASITYLFCSPAEWKVKGFFNSHLKGHNAQFGPQTKHLFYSFGLFPSTGPCGSQTKSNSPVYFLIRIFVFYIYSFTKEGR